MKLEFLSVEDLDRLIDELTPQDKENLAAKLFKKLSPEARTRVMGLTDSSIQIVTGSSVILDNDVVVHVAGNVTASEFPERLVKAFLEYRRSQQS